MVEKEPRLSAQALKVLRVLLASPRDELSGAEIGRETGIASGSLYPILLRFEQVKWLQSRWETEEPHALGRPRRRFYRVTALGAKKAKAAFQDVMAVQWRPAWGSSGLS